MEATENGLIWQKASASAAQNGCVEVGSSPASPVVGLRDTTSRERGKLTVDLDAFAAFLADTKGGRYDLGE
jgi:hypothetical protein